MIRRGRRATWAALFLLALQTPPALAEQALIPTPYPDAAPGATPLDPEPSETGGPQRIMRDPYPQATGDFSQGNPPIFRHRHQHLVPSIYKRKYRVDRP